MQSVLSSYLDKITENARSKVGKGTAFEKIVRIFLENDKMQTQQYDAVWTYEEWAEERGLATRDTGVDLVARHRGSDEFCFIQCKFHASDKILSVSNLSTFMAKANMQNVRSLMIVDTTLGELSKSLITNLNEADIEWRRVKIYDLENSTIDWESCFENGELKDEIPASKKKNEPMDHQEDAIKAVTKGFKTADRGKMIMACGTGKTFTALRLAEDMGGAGKIILYMVPSLSLMSQTVFEWKGQARKDFSAFSVCSDSYVGRRGDDNLFLPIHELVFPATTNAKDIATQVKKADPNQMTVVFSTYHSVETLTEAQEDYGMPEFDLIICDEAHRTTGISEAKRIEHESRFAYVHLNKHVKGKKRLYMTATPKIFGEPAKEKAKKNSAEIASMDDPKTFGEEFYRLDFSAAVDKKLLSDYKVLVLAVDEKYVSATMQEYLSESSILNSGDITKIIGCYKALTKYGLTRTDREDREYPPPMKRALMFNSLVDDSKDLVAKFTEVIEKHWETDRNAKLQHKLHIQARHIDGTHNAKERSATLKWLAEDSQDESEEDICRILSNVRCLSEGVDVPALDAIMFMQPRKSQVEVVQAVGRVMRRAPGKEFGYVILPVIVKASATPEDALDKNKDYKVIWQVLNALRTHDARLDSIINKISLGGEATDKIQIIGVSKDFDDDTDSNTQLFLDFPEFVSGIYAQIVLKCGTRTYWDIWAKDVAEIARKYILLISDIIKRNEAARAAFDGFLAEIQDDLNPEVTKTDAIEMLAQHLITKPIFDTLFKDNEFTKHNAVSKAMEAVLDQLERHNLNKEAKSLQKFYDSVQERASVIETAKERQALMVELYNSFFSDAFPTLTEKLGIVYTPTEVVDFIIHSVNDVLQSEFKKTLGERDVHIIDPFTGTGTFITRLLQSGLITAEQMKYKYEKEIHANEIVLLAYYIAAINIESVYHDLMAESQGTKPPYTPFGGMVLTDTFQLYEQEKDMVADLMPDNSKRRTAQKARDIRVIFGNPPYSAGQKSSNDNAQNIEYKNLDAKIRDTYAKYSTATNKKALYDSYIRAIRWASDRLKAKGDDAGVIAYVSNASWIDGNATDGVRKCLKEEFSSLYIFHLRGNQRTSGEKSRKEGGKIFGAGSRAPIAISVLVRNPEAKKFGKIYFHGVDDYLDRKQKLAIVENFKSIDGITARNGWREITPDKHHDWLNQRDPSFAKHISIGTKKVKTEAIIFTDYSNGAGTSRDAWAYNSSRKALADNMKRMIDFYDSEVARYAEHGAGQKPDSFIDADPKKISWSRSLKANLAKGKTTIFDSKKPVVALYRPFQKQYLYFDPFLVESPGQIPKLFPHAKINNRVIAISGVSANNFSALMCDCIPNLDLLEKTQSFPLKLYEAPNDDDLLDSKTTDYTPRDGISDEGLEHFQKKYKNKKISKEDVFYYIYGLLHSNDYRKKFKNNLSKELPRIPAVKTAADFWAFSKAGRKLGDLHVNYESAPLYDRTNIQEDDLLTKDTPRPPEHYRVEKMEFGGPARNKDKSVVKYNDNITITNIPLAAYEYIVNGKSALEWVMERQSVTVDDKNKSKIKNDANDYATETMFDPAYPLKLFQRVLTVSLETMKIVNALPPLDID